MAVALAPALGSLASKIGPIALGLLAQNAPTLGKVAQTTANALFSGKFGSPEKLAQNLGRKIIESAQTGHGRQQLIKTASNVLSTTHQGANEVLNLLNKSGILGTKKKAEISDLLGKKMHSFQSALGAVNRISKLF